MSSEHVLERSGKGAYSINEFCADFSIGRTLAYVEIRTGRLKTIKVGRRTLIPVASVENWLNAHLKRQA